MSSLWNDTSLRCKSFFFRDSISPGSSHPSIQCGARPLTGDLPTTAPSPVTFEIWKLSPTLMNCLWLYLLLKCWAIAQHLWNIKISYNYVVMPQLISRKNCQKTRRMAGQETGHPHIYGSAGGYHMLCLPPSSLPLGIFNLTRVYAFVYFVYFWGDLKSILVFFFCVCVDSTMPS